MADGVWRMGYGWDVGREWWGWIRRGRGGRGGCGMVEMGDCGMWDEGMGLGMGYRG